MPYRVLIVSHGHPELSPGGAEFASYLLFDGLRRRRGLEVYYLAYTDDPFYRRDDTPFSLFRGRSNEILVFIKGADPFLFSQQSPVLIDRFASLLAQIAPDIVHFHHYTQLGLELIATVRRSLPCARIILTLHEYLAICHHYGQMVKTGTMALCTGADPHSCSQCFRDRTPGEFLRRERFIKAHFEKVDLFVSPSTFLRQRYIAWGLPPERITCVDNALPPILPPAPRPLAANDRRSVFAFFGQINPYKGVLQLLSAFALLDRFPPDSTRGLRLIIHGANLEFNPPQFIAAFRKLLARAAPRVHFAGGYERRDQHRLMAAIDWVVVPSVWWENSPLVIEEALAHRRPVICSQIGGMAEKIRPGKDGFHFPVGDPYALAKLIVELAASGVWNELQMTMRSPAPLDEVVSEHLRLYRDHRVRITV